MKTSYQILRDKVKMNNFTFVEQEAICAAMEEYASQFNKPPVYGQWIDVKERLPEPNILVLCVDHRFNRMMVADWMDYTNQDKEWFTRMFTHWTTLPPSPGSVDVEEKKEQVNNFLKEKDGRFINPTEDEVMLFICDAYNVFVETRDKFKLMDFILDKTPHRIITRTQSDGLGDSSGSEKEEHQSIHYWAGRLIGHHQAYAIAEEIIDAITSARLSVKEVSREGEIAELHEKLEEITFYEEEARRQIGIRDQLLEDIFYNRLKPEVIKHKIDQILNLPF